MLRPLGFSQGPQKNPIPHMQQGQWNEQFGKYGSWVGLTTENCPGSRELTTPLECRNHTKPSAKAENGLGAEHMYEIEQRLLSSASIMLKVAL